MELAADHVAHAVGGFVGLMCHGEIRGGINQFPGCCPGLGATIGLTARPTRLHVYSFTYNKIFACKITPYIYNMVSPKQGILPLRLGMRRKAAGRRGSENPIYWRLPPQGETANFAAEKFYEET